MRHTCVKRWDLVGGKDRCEEDFGNFVAKVRVQGLSMTRPSRERVAPASGVAVGTDAVHWARTGKDNSPARTLDWWAAAAEGKALALRQNRGEDCR